MATQADLMRELVAMYRSGIHVVSAAMIAERLWPDGRDHNSNGQVFPLAAGVAGRMLRKCPAVIEIRNREWEIINERLMYNVELTGRGTES